MQNKRKELPGSPNPVQETNSSIIPKEERNRKKTRIREIEESQNKKNKKDRTGRRTRRGRN